MLAIEINVLMITACVIRHCLQIQLGAHIVYWRVYLYLGRVWVRFSPYSTRRRTPSCWGLALGMTPNVSISRLSSQSVLTMTMAFTGQSKVFSNISGRNFLFGQSIFNRESPFAGWHMMLVNCRDILPERTKNSACWDLGGISILTWPSSDSLCLP